MRADSRFASSQWETALQSNAVSHWLDAILEAALGYGAGSWNPSLWKTGTCTPCMVNIMSVDGMVICGARASAAMVLTSTTRIFWCQHLEGLFMFLTDFFKVCIDTVGELRSTLCTKTPIYVGSGLYIKQMPLEHLSYIKQMPLEHLSYIKETSWNTSGGT